MKGKISMKLFRMSPKKNLGRILNVPVVKIGTPSHVL